ncbi:hypothetical protein [Butyrivibrio proteoclasticus]|uniref:hypothetical protein n=1 Tax=Butyrivibrio proteoclasticus TaxID=43305 RepID=UPI00047C00CC|nr:hypothetical protein [Butyrivibrio proteoclasticus]
MKKKIAVRVMAAVLILTMGAGIGGVFVSSSKDFHFIESQTTLPMIDRDAATDYESGKISKETALNRISNRLDSLKSDSAIEDWEYDENNDCVYITMNGGSVFSYNF